MTARSALLLAIVFPSLRISVSSFLFTVERMPSRRPSVFRLVIQHLSATN
jgi:hypothetical protein